MAYTLITGASGGIGEALAEQFAAHGHNLVLSARTTEKLETVAARLRQAHGVSVVVITCDLSEPAAAEELHRRVEELDLSIDCLVNNAGFGDHAALLDANPARTQQLIQVNIASVVQLTGLFGNRMRERGHGRILNLSSVAAFSAGPNMSCYYASKAFVLSFSQALSVELAGTGVTCTALCPGPTNTGFARAAAMEGGTSRMFDFFPQTPQTVARAGYRACMRGRSLRLVGPVTHGYNLLTRLLPRTVCARIAQHVDG